MGWDWTGWTNNLVERHHRLTLAGELDVYGPDQGRDRLGIPFHIRLCMSCLGEALEKD